MRGSPQNSSSWLKSPWFLVPASLVAIGIAGQVFSTNDDGLDSPTSSTVPVTIQTTSTSVAELGPPVDDLPSYSTGSTDLAGLVTAESLLTALDLAGKANAQWTEEDQAAIDGLRTLAGIGPGGLDRDLWKIIFSLPRAPLDEAKDSGIEKVKVPAVSVGVGSGPTGYRTPQSASFIVPSSATGPEILAWFKDRYPATDFGKWRWCGERSLSPSRTEISWWQRPGRRLAIVVEDRGRGRVDFAIAVQEEVSVAECQGAQRNLSDLQVNSSQYRWRDAGLDWIWRPTGTYKNLSDTTITYAQITYEIVGANGFSSTYVDDPMDDLGPGKTAGIMPSTWFTLSVAEFDESQIGMAISYGAGASYNFYVNYIRYEDGSSVGQEKFIG